MLGGKKEGKNGIFGVVRGGFWAEFREVRVGFGENSGEFQESDEFWIIQGNSRGFRWNFGFCGHFVGDFFCGRVMGDFCEGIFW